MLFKPFYAFVIFILKLTRAEDNGNMVILYISRVENVSYFWRGRAGNTEEQFYIYAYFTNKVLTVLDLQKRRVPVKDLVGAA